MRRRLPRYPAALAALAFVLGFLAAPCSAAEPAPPGPSAAAPVAPAGPTAAIEGFRSAHFGMAEDEVREAIRKDFAKGVGKPAAAIHPSEKTRILSLAVRDLLPDTGEAHVSYIFGYRSKRLIQVNIVWVSDARSAASDEAVVGTANALRDYFAAENYPPGNVVKNRPLGDETILVFRAADHDGHMALLVLSGAGAAARAKDKALAPLTLELSYIADSAHPDVFRIGRGQF